MHLSFLNEAMKIVPKVKRKRERGKKHNELKHDWNACYKFRIKSFAFYSWTLLLARTANEPMFNNHFLKSYFKWCVWLVRALAVDAVQNWKINSKFFTNKTLKTLHQPVATCKVKCDDNLHTFCVSCERNRKRKRDRAPRIVSKRNNSFKTLLALKF